MSNIISTFDVGRETVARTVIQDVLLLAIGTEAAPAEKPQPADTAAGQKSETPPASPRQDKTDQKLQSTATLAVTPADAQRLIIASTKGIIRLALRPANEREYVPMPGIDAYSVIGVRPPEVNPPPAQKSESTANTTGTAGGEVGHSGPALGSSPAGDSTGPAGQTRAFG